MEPPKAGLIPLGERIAAALEAETQPEQQLRAARSQLLERVTSMPERTLRARAVQLRYAALAALVLLAAAGAAVQSFYRPISFVTNAGKRDVGDVLEGVRRESLQVEFSEGSRMLLHQGTRARVLDTQAAGARVLLESGVVDVAIVHRPSHATRWRFEAGPFQVLVKGTRFALGWKPASQSLSLTMTSGSVELSGACLPAPRIVARGASVQLSCTNTAPTLKFEVVSAAPAIPRAQATPPALPAASPNAPASAAPAATPSLQSKPVPHGYEASCETAGKAELVAIANRERLAGHVARARTALLALRRRFAGSSEAGTAAFTLGRMAFDQQGDYGEAAHWFGSYLAEQPNGPLMGDATGRLLEAHDRQGDRAAARRDAQHYLQRFPDGPYAKSARRIFAE